MASTGRLAGFLWLERDYDYRRGIADDLTPNVVVEVFLNTSRFSCRP